MTSRSSRTATWVAAAATAGAAGWGVRHATSPSVRRWRAGAGSVHRAGLLQVRTFGSGTPVVVLLHVALSV